MVQRVAAGIPSGPLVDPETGDVMPAWRALLMSLYGRTGGSTGGIAPTQADVAAEAAARQAADEALAAALDREAAARAAGDAANTAAIAAEGTVRRTGDTLHTSGTGAPTGAATVGALYSRTDGGVGTTLYVSRGGGSWLAVAGV
jgi:hypothetical protein